MSKVTNEQISKKITDAVAILTNPKTDVEKTSALQKLLDIRKELLTRTTFETKTIESIEKTIKAQTWEKGSYGVGNTMVVTKAQNTKIDDDLLTKKLEGVGLKPEAFKVNVFDYNNPQLVGFLTLDVKVPTTITTKVSFK